MASYSWTDRLYVEGISALAIRKAHKISAFPLCFHSVQIILDDNNNNLLGHRNLTFLAENEAWEQTRPNNLNWLEFKQ